jgi:TonB family protein
MRLYGLRILVALLTFAAGVAASWLPGFGSPARFERRVVVDVPVLVSAQEPPRRACHDTFISGGVLDGKAVSKPAPVYPPAAKAAGIEGTVIVFVVVNEGGRVTKAEALSGPSALRDAAVEAARQAVFSPTNLSGGPIRVTGTVTYNFILD